jgi:predicted HicB family RNase H-like nuclease
MPRYKECSGRVEYDDEAGLFHGEVLDLGANVLGYEVTRQRQTSSKRRQTSC